MAVLESSELIPLQRAADVVGLHRATLNEMIRDGRLEGVREGPYWYLRADVLERFAQTYRRPKNSPARASRRPVASTELLALVGDWGEATVAELARVLQLHQGNIRKHLAIAQADGLAFRDRFGSWQLTETARDYLTRVLSADGVSNRET